MISTELYAHVKITRDEIQRMGTWLSSVWWGGDPDLPDPVSGLSLRDLHLVKKSWAPIYRQRVENGTEIFKRVFRASPETRDQFRMLRGVAEEDYSGNAQFKAHVINLMTAFDSFIGTLQQPDVAAAMMTKLGDSHNKRKIKKAHFQMMEEMLMAMFKELKFDEQTLSAWSKSNRFMYKHIFTQLVHDA